MTDAPRSQQAREHHDSHAVPPLVWIVLAILVIVVAIAAIQHRGTHVTPQGRTMPTASSNPADQRSQ